MIEIIHDLESLERERELLQATCEDCSPPPSLALFTAMTTGDPEAFSQRVKDVLSAALAVGATENPEEDLPTANIPEWFVQICENPDGSPAFAREGREEFLRNFSSGPWSIQDWLYRFTPDEESRGWNWWGFTRTETGEVHLWVDSWGESFFGCDDLRWLVCTAGGKELRGPVIERAEMWKSECYGNRSD